VIRVTDWANNYVGYSSAPVTYTPGGAVTSIVNGHSCSLAGIATSKSYNKRLQPAVLSAAADPSQPFLGLSYNFNLGHDNGNILGITNSVDSTRSAAFAYDNLNRLQQANTVTTTG
jgi:hypothetical protein